jgi:SulP family sulfate permease
VRQWELLQAQGEQLLIFKLQGFIFFGTANNLFERIRTRIRRPPGSPVRFILLDFEQVSGLDSTGLLSFSKLLQFAHKSKIELIMTGLTKSIRDQLFHGGFTKQTHGVHLFADMDRGIEWCEDQIIAGIYSAWVPDADLHDQLLTIVPDKTRVATLLEHMQRREVAAGEYIIRQGEEPDQLFFLVSGQLTAQLEKPGRAPVRLETMQSGRMVGELGFFLGTRRNASVVADCPSGVYVLTRTEWSQIKKHNPEVAQTLNSLAIHLLAQRVSHLTRVVDALQY